MTVSNHPEAGAFGDPATYRIVVKGALSDAKKIRFTGMSIKSVDGNGNSPRTILVGQVQDQAELRGVLDALYGLHLSVVSVKLFNDS